MKRAAIELWKAKVPLATIRKQLKLSERSLRRILAQEKQNPGGPIPDRKKSPGSGSKRKISKETLEGMKELLRKNPTLTAKNLKARLLDLENISIRTIQENCQKTLGFPCRKMAEKPLLSRRMMDARLDFARRYQNWTVEDWKKVMFSDDSHFELCFGRHIRSKRCRRPRNSDRFDTRFTQKTVKHPPKVMA